MLNLCRRTRQAGAGLVELMIGSAVGLIVLSGIVTFYSDTARKNAAGLAQVRLNHDIQTALFLMTRDIRRTGYRAALPANSDWIDNPFHGPANALRIAQDPGEAPDSCIIFSYDLNDDGKVGVGSTQIKGAHYSASNQERFGYRLRNGAIQMRTGGKRFDCTAGSWQSVTEPQIAVDHLQFTLKEECRDDPRQDAACTSGLSYQSLRTVNIQLSGHLAKHPQVRTSLVQAVFIRNPYLSPATPGRQQ